MLATQVTAFPTQEPVAFIGLGAMGILMAKQLVRSGIPVVGYDINPAAVAALVSAGGEAALSPAEACRNVRVVIVMVATAGQAIAALFGEEGDVGGRTADGGTAAIDGVADGATVIIHATVAPSFPAEVRAKLDRETDRRRDVRLIDAPVSGGTKRAADGTLTIMASSAQAEDLERADVKRVLACMAQKVYPVPGGLGSAMKVKVLNQLLCGVHIVAAAEIMGLTAVLGLGTQQFYEYVVSPLASHEGDATKRRGCWSWLFEDRVPRMLEERYVPPSSAVGIFVKDMGIVMQEAAGVGMSLSLAQASQTKYELGVQRGLGREDDSGVVRLYLGPDSGWEKDLSLVWTERVKSRAVSLDASREAELTGLLGESLEAIHLVAAHEALRFARGLGLTRDEAQTRQWKAILSSAAAGSTAFIEVIASLLEEDEMVGNLNVRRLESLNKLIALAEEERYSPTLCRLAHLFYQSQSTMTGG